MFLSNNSPWNKLSTRRWCSFGDCVFSGLLVEYRVFTTVSFFLVKGCRLSKCFLDPLPPDDEHCSSPCVIFTHLTAFAD